MEQNSESITKRILNLNNLLLRSTSDSKAIAGSCLISREVLVDALILLYDECNNEFLMKDPLIADFVEKYRSTVLKIRDLNVNISDFEVKKVISRGRFAEVSVVREKSSQNVCVLKKIRKSDILNVSERILFESERNLLISALCDCEAKKWVPHLYYSFQNMKYLYYVLEYCPGGNLCTMLDYYKKNVPEPMLRFYLAEMIQAIQAIHSIGFVHRDIRPENVLIDKGGHVKLVDFGSSAKLSRHGQITSKVVFSTPNYTAPEIFKFHESPTSKGYSAQCDWWSLGIVLFELVCGNVPFNGDEASKLHLSSNNYPRRLQYPKHVNISQELKNIISGLLQPAEKRSNYDKLVHLDYFNDIVWTFLHERDPPFVPSLNSAEDTSYFTTFEVQRPTPKVEDYKLQRRFTGRNLPFLGFTYMGNDMDSDDSSSSSSSYVISKLPASFSERRKTENYTTTKENEFDALEMPRHSTGSYRDSKLHSECSDESYQSASDMYNCITEDQAKFLLEKQRMTKEFKEKEEKLMQENNVLEMTNKSLENELNEVKTKYNDLEVRYLQLDRNLEDTTDKLKKTEKLRKDSTAKLNQEIQKLNKDLQEKCDSMKELEEKMLNLSNQQAAKLAVLSKTRTTLRSKSTERDKFEQDNVSLKNQLAEANKKIAKLTQDLEKKGKVKLDLEFKMTAASEKSGNNIFGRGDGASGSKADENSKEEIDKLNKELQKKHQEISDLQDALKKEKEQKLKEISDLTTKLNRDLDRKQKELCDLKEKSTKDLDKKQKEISDLRNELHEKQNRHQREIDDLRKKLNLELQCKTKEMADLRSTLDQNQKEKQKEMNELRDKFNEEQKRKQKELSDLNNKLNQEQKQKLKDISDLQDKLDRERKVKMKEIEDLRERNNQEQKQKQKLTETQQKLSQECEQAQKEISNLREKLNEEQKQKCKEISDLLEKVTQEQKCIPKEIAEIRANFMKELDRKQKEILDVQDKLCLEQKNSQKIIRDLKENFSVESDKKDKQISDLKVKFRTELEDKQKEINNLQIQISKMNEDAFANLVSIEDLKTAVEEKNKSIKKYENEIGKLKKQSQEKSQHANLVSSEDLKTAIEEKNKTIKKYENEISKLKKELQEKSQQVSSIRMSLCQSDKEKEKLESKIEALLNEIKHCNDIKLKELEANRIDPNEVLKQFENTMRDVIKENLRSKDNVVTTSDFEKLLNTLQRRVSLTCLPIAVSKTESLGPEKKDIAVLEAQIERLESQLEKHQETAILQREAATQAKKELEDTKKELSNIKIDLRIAQRETKEAEEKLEKLQASKYKYYKKLEDEKDSLETKLKEVQQTILDLESQVENLKNDSVSKEDFIKKKEAEINELTSKSRHLEEEMNHLKSSNRDLKKDKKNLEDNLKEKESEIKQLKSKISKMKEEIKQNKTTFNSVKEEEESWKNKCAGLESTVASIKETCLLLDKQVENFENYNQELEEKLGKSEEEKLRLKEELDQLTSELKSSKKMVNEEKSLKIFAENKVRLLESDLQKKDKDIESLEEDINAKSEHIVNLEDQIKHLEEYISSADQSLHKNSEYVNLVEKEVLSLKKERTELLTSIHRLTKEKNELTKELEEATSDLNDLQKANGDLQSVLAQVEAYHEIRHLKDNETLQQHSKLIDFLQTKFQDATKQKRTLADKIFRNKGKENLNPKELENLLYSERNKSKGLAEQLYQARIELMMLRGENISKCSSPKTITDYESNLSRTTTKNQLTSISNLSEMEMPNTRIKHNIPHKFETKRCRKTLYKCSVCSVSISTGHHSYCKECHVWCHVSCTQKIGPTCGLPQALMEQFSNFTKTQSQSQFTSSQSSIKSEIEGNIKVLRGGKWENMAVYIESKFLTLHDKTASSVEPKLRIPFSAVKSVDDNVDFTPTSNDISCVFKIIYREENDQKTLHLRASSEDDKANWMNILKRNITPKQISFKFDSEQYFKGNVVCSFSDSDRLTVNQMVQLAPELCLLGTEEGLYSLKLNSTPENGKIYNPVKISGVDKVSKIKVLTKLRIALLICGDENTLKKCDLRMLVSNAEAAACSSPSILIDKASTEFNLNSCSLLEASPCNSLISLIADDHFMVLEWNDLAFDLVRYRRRLPDLKCSLFTTTSILYSTAFEFYRIDLDTMNENKLKVFKCSTELGSKLCEPEAIVKINTDLYLVCDKLFGIFIDADGKRIKYAETIKWPLPLKRIVYNKPFLCVVHENCVSLVYLPSTNEGSEEKLKFSIIDFDNPAVLGIVKQPIRGMYIKEEDRDGCKLFFLDPVLFMKRNPKQSWSSISTHSGQTTDEECIQKSLNISSETDVSLNSSLLESSNEERI
ncbi:citron Rho-interacting kinase-like isoform X2 [Planococcus citri]|uniref:citron Rho-interacting kinase-like isoform X2 n=1 Tax=Planococcus citri TaxID=170843 RepID=UPI0031F798D6